MSTVRSIERRLYVRRQVDRDMAAQAVVGGEASRHMEWNGVWTGYMTFAGVGILLVSFVLGVGFSSLNPLSAASWAGVGRGTLAWIVVVVLISTYLGAWVAGRSPGKTSKRHGMMRGITLWGLIMVTVLGLIMFVSSTAISATTNVAGPAVGALAPTSATALRGMLSTNGITITQAQAAAISAEMAAGNRTAAANTLAADANITAGRAGTLLGNTAAPIAGAAAQVPKAVQATGGSLSWGLFWIALIGFGCALTGGAIGAGGVPMRRRSPKPAA